MPSRKDFISKEKLNPVTLIEQERIEEEGKKVVRNKMVYKQYNRTYEFRTFETIHTFGNEIRNNVINMRMANNEEIHLAKYI